MRRPRAAQRGWARRPWRERVAILRRRGRADPRAEVRARRAHEPRGRQEPARGDGRRRGVGRPDRLLLRPGGGGRRLRPADGADHADRAQHRRAPAVRRLRLHRAVQLSAGALGRDVLRRAGGGQRGGLQAGRGHALDRPRDCTRSTAMPDCRRACSTSSSGRRDEIGDALWQHPGVDGVVFTGSKAVGLRIHAGLGARLDQALPAGARRQERGDRHAQRGPRRRRRRRHAVGVQPAEPEVQRDVAGLRAPRRGRAVHWSACSSRPRAIRMGDPIGARRLLRSGDQRSARSSATSAPSPRPGRRAPSSSAGRGSEAGSSTTATSSRPRSPGFRSTSSLFREELFVPFLAVGEVERPRRGARARRMRAEYGLTAGIFSRDAAEVERFFDEIEAGVCYANKRTGATTGAWPGRPGVLRLEGIGLDRQGRLRTVLRRAVHCASRAGPSSKE